MKKSYRYNKIRRFKNKNYKPCTRKVSNEELGERFKFKGRFEKRRNIYLKTKRTGKRILELQKLSNDIDFAIDLLRQLERRTKIPSLISINLRNLQMMLFYLNNRYSFNSDFEIFRAMGDYFCLDWQVCQQVVLHKRIETEWFLLETEGNKESI